MGHSKTINLLESLIISMFVETMSIAIDVPMLSHLIYLHHR